MGKSLAPDNSGGGLLEMKGQFLFTNMDGPLTDKSLLITHEMIDIDFFKVCGVGMDL